MKCTVRRVQNKKGQETAKEIALLHLQVGRGVLRRQDWCQMGHFSDLVQMMAHSLSNAHVHGCANRDDGGVFLFKFSLNLGNLPGGPVLQYRIYYNLSFTPPIAST
ncbi:hypothetical protein CCM_01632 [Cordyceps militaris CM01]|uniref:Uncharacterized protein n=1 Tax=Cordyceps militaris (strain CM01) TaxID=983644 RepID=G3J674_CORMM|nr:uncharacterized protein CCM_01632 [Cordyceps militaris CM01]EGX96973.1 hypothetical protein CCM_01632 [Cordyceps militaris CM01]